MWGTDEPPFSLNLQNTRNMHIKGNSCNKHILRVRCAAGRAPSRGPSKPSGGRFCVRAREEAKDGTGGCFGKGGGSGGQGSMGEKRCGGGLLSKLARLRNEVRISPNPAQLIFKRPQCRQGEPTGAEPTLPESAANHVEGGVKNAGGAKTPMTRHPCTRPEWIEYIAETVP